MTQCPSPATLAAFIDGSDPTVQLTQHLAECDNCRELFVEASLALEAVEEEEQVPNQSGVIPFRQARPWRRRLVGPLSGLLTAAALILVFLPVVKNHRAQAVMTEVTANYPHQLRELVSSGDWDPRVFKTGITLEGGLVEKAPRSRGRKKRKEVSTFDKQLASLRKVLDGNTRAHGLFLSLCLVSGRYDQAIDAGLPRVDDPELQAMYLVAGYLAGTGDKRSPGTELIADMGALYAVHKNSPLITFNMARLLTDAGKRDEANAAWRHYLTIVAEDDPLAGQARFYLGIAGANRDKQ